MPRQIPIDCLNKIFEYLDEAALYSCLLVNRLWCETSVQILWTNIQNYNTVIAYLPNESKEILSKNEIIISSSTSNPPLFNCTTFIKSLSMCEIIENIFRIFQPTILQGFNYDKKMIVAREIFKMFMNQISLKKFDFLDFDVWFHKLDHYSISTYLSDLPFPTYPGAIDCLKNLSDLECVANSCSELFSQLSHTCQNLQSLKIYLKSEISNGLLNLISVQ